VEKGKVQEGGKAKKDGNRMKSITSFGKHNSPHTLIRTIPNEGIKLSQHDKKKEQKRKRKEGEGKSPQKRVIPGSLPPHDGLGGQRPKGGGNYLTKGKEGVREAPREILRGGERIKRRPPIKLSKQRKTKKSLQCREMGFELGKKGEERTTVCAEKKKLTKKGKEKKL